jgi:hypothetical protein
MGVVYRAYHAQLERTGAVKVLQGLAPDPDTVARFRREAQSIARMRHPNIVNVFDFGEFEGTPYMIVEFVEGGSLSSKVKSGPLEPAIALAYLHGIASALDYAHSRGIVHRDIKPANVLLGPDNSPILADFGLAKLMESSSIKSLTGVTTGTPAYMAPEQVTGHQVGPASDLYSLAVIAYEMLTGTLPFDEGGVLEVMYAQVHKSAAPPSSRNPRLGLSVDAVIMRGLAKDPQARWDHGESFVAALETALAANTGRAAEQTVAMPAPMPGLHPPPPAVKRPKPASPSATVAVSSSAGGIRGPDPTFAPPVITRRGIAVPASAVKPRKSRAGMYIAIGLAATILALGIGGVAAYEAFVAINLTVNPPTASPGDSVLVTASHLPSNQGGQIRLEIGGASQATDYRADVNGNVSQYVLVPFDVAAGDYTLSICWSAVCHATTVLHVIRSAAYVGARIAIRRALTEPVALDLAAVRFA